MTTGVNENVSEIPTSSPSESNAMSDDTTTGKEDSTNITTTETNQSTSNNPLHELTTQSENSQGGSESSATVEPLESTVMNSTTRSSEVTLPDNAENTTQKMAEESSVTDTLIEVSTTEKTQEEEAKDIPMINTATTAVGLNDSSETVTGNLTGSQDPQLSSSEPSGLDKGNLTEITTEALLANSTASTSGGITPASKIDIVTSAANVTTIENIVKIENSTSPLELQNNQPGSNSTDMKSNQTETATEALLTNITESGTALALVTVSQNINVTFPVTNATTTDTITTAPPRNTESLSTLQRASNDTVPKSNRTENRPHTTITTTEASTASTMSVASSASKIPIPTSPDVDTTTATTAAGATPFTEPRNYYLLRCPECFNQPAPCPCSKASVKIQPIFDEEFYRLSNERVLSRISRCRDSPLQYGYCSGRVKAWSYLGGNTCGEFVFSRCGNSRNVFPTKEECLRACGISVSIGSNELW